jgi:Na+-transporting NADH:ubiquinone oxidoreductase subunit NqrB
MNMSKLSKTLKNPKVQLLLVLFLLAAAGIADGDGEAKALMLVITIPAAILAEWALFGAVPAAALQSAVITGIITGQLLAPGNLTAAWTAAVVAVASKKFLRFHNGKHIFNPAAFGLLFSVIAFGNRLNWWGSSSTLIIVIGAGLVLFRMHRLSLPFSCFITRTASILLFGGLGTFREAVLLPNLFFAFIMLAEPKTSPGKRAEQWVFGGLCGIFATVFYRFIPAFEGDLVALLAVNLLRFRMSFRLPVLRRRTERDV